jgi:DNA-directed RNA polymerase specialized sigma24 family protein
LHRALQTVTPESELHFYRLSALQIRYVLLDLAQRYSSCSGLTASYETGFEGIQRQSPDPCSRGTEFVAVTLDEWGRFHQLAGNLPQEHRDLFDLLWYQGLNQGEAARLLGVTLRTVQRRWHATRLIFMRRLDRDVLIR